MTTSNENNHSENLEKDRQNKNEIDTHLSEEDKKYIQKLLVPIDENEPVGKEPILIDSSTDHSINAAMEANDWLKAKTLIEETLIKEQKGLKYVIWLIQCLIELKSFEGAYLGLYLFNEMFDNFWNDFYPKKATQKEKILGKQFSFINKELIVHIKMCSITDKKSANEYSFYDYEDSRSMKYLKEVMNKYNEVTDEKGYEIRQEKIKNEKLSPEKFDEAMNATSVNFYQYIESYISLCIKQIERMDDLIDKLYTNPSNAPGLTDIKDDLATVKKSINTFIHSKKPIEKEEYYSQDANATQHNLNKQVSKENLTPHDYNDKSAYIQQAPNSSNIHPMADPFAVEQGLWKEIKLDAIQKLKTNGLQYILNELLKRSEYSPSLRIKKRFHLLMAQLCIMDKREDLASPIARQLNELLDNENETISHWEANSWIAEVYDTFYQCLINDDEASLKEELKIKICKTDVTKLMSI